MSNNDHKGTIYDRKIQSVFEDWIIESGIKVRFKTITYYIESKLSFFDSYILSLFGIFPKNNNILHIVTTDPDKFFGGDNHLLYKYKAKFLSHNIKSIEIHQVKNQDHLLEGVIKKLKRNKKKIK